MLQFLYKNVYTISVQCGYYIRETVDSLCRDDVDMPMPPYIIYEKLATAPTLHFFAFLGS